MTCTSGGHGGFLNLPDATTVVLVNDNSDYTDVSADDGANGSKGGFANLASVAGTGNSISITGASTFDTVWSSF